MFYRGPQVGLDTNIRIFFEIFKSFRDISKILENFMAFRAFLAVFQLFLAIFLTDYSVLSYILC